MSSSLKKFRLMPREEYEDGTLESIETWIKREAARLVSEDWRADEFKEDIEKLEAERAKFGIAYSDANSAFNKARAALAKKRDAEKVRAQKEYQEALKDERKKVQDSKAAHVKKVRELKTLKAKYNTHCKKFFNAVSKRVFQNMRSICGIQHTWGDPKVKRDIQRGDVKKGLLPKSLVSTKLERNPVANGEFEE